VLRAAAAEVGLDSVEMQAAVVGGRFSAVLDEYIRQAQEWGITAVPTYILGDQYEIVGAQPYEVFEQALHQLGVSPKSRASN
jgi:predicted DsbA family dithiol-disulfide isomerase